MEFRNMVMMTLYARQQKRHKCKEQTFGLLGEGKGGMIWENSIETCIAVCETDDQCKLDAWSRALKAGALGQPRGIGWGGRWEEGSGPGDTRTPGWFMSLYGKKHHSIVK